MQIKITNGPVLHPVALDPEYEDQRTREHAERAARGEAFDAKALDKFNFERGGYSLRFEDGGLYEVDDEVGEHLTRSGWAVELPEGTKVKKGDLAEPFDTRNATDEDAEQWENEVLAPARERQQVLTTRFIGTGTNEVLKGDPYDGDESVRVVDLGKGESAPEDGAGATLDVHDATTSSTTEV